MEIKETPDMWVLHVARNLRIPDVREAAAECAPLIERQMDEAGLDAAGPWIFIAHGLPKDGRTSFDWEICRPVVKPAHYAGAIELRHLQPILVASKVYQGPLRSLFTKGYAPLVAEIERSRHGFSGESREIYHDWSGPGAPCRTVEIQFGLAR